MNLGNAMYSTCKHPILRQSVYSPRPCALGFVAIVSQRSHQLAKFSFPVYRVNDILFKIPLNAFEVNFLYP